MLEKTISNIIVTGDMMNKAYTNKLIYDYLWCNDITDPDIETLENNPDFMATAMEKSKDKKLYNLCSDNVRTNYDFVKRIVILFKEDFSFIEKVANTYLESIPEKERSDNKDCIELNILISNLFPKEISKYILSSAAFYEVENIRVETCLSYLDDENLRSQSKSGFIFSAVEYEDYPLILNYIAMRMYRKAMYSNNRLEILLHKRFKTVEELERYGDLKFIYDIVFDYDECLGTYMFNSPQYQEFASLIKETIKDISFFKKNWQNYVDRINAKKVSIFEHELLAKTVNIDLLSYDDILEFVTHHLGLKDIFSKNDNLYTGEYHEEKYKTLKMRDVSIINSAMSLARKLFSDDIKEEDYDEYINDDEKIDSVEKPQESVKTSTIKFKFIK